MGVIKVNFIIKIMKKIQNLFTPTINSIDCHPLVLLHVVDHLNRMETKKRVCGIILGTFLKNGTLKALNAFAVPFDEDLKTGIFFIDHSYIHEMASMFKRVNAMEMIIGWYHTGGELKSNDLKIHFTMRKYINVPILFVFNCDSDVNVLPVKAYLTKKITKNNFVEEIDKFINIDLTLTATESETVGVEQCLRNLPDQEDLETLKQELKTKKNSLLVMQQRLVEIRSYLINVKNRNLPLNQDVLHLIQEIFNILPIFSSANLKESIIKLMNDQSTYIYMASFVRCTLMIDQLIKNREKRIVLLNK